MKKFKTRHLWKYDPEIEYFTFQLFTIDINKEGISIIILNFSLYYSI